MVEGMLHPLEAPERLSQKCTEPVVGNATDSGQEHMTQEQVFVRLDYHLVLVLKKVLDEISRYQVYLHLE